MNIDKSILIIDDDLERDYKALEENVAVFMEPVTSYVRAATPLLKTPNTTVLNRNTNGSCFIYATFEMLWHGVLPWVVESIFEKEMITKSSNEFDKVLMRTYELHSSGTLEGRVAASEEIRSFEWSLDGYNKGR